MKIHPITTKSGKATFSTDVSLLDMKMIHHYLSIDSYWGQGRTYEKVKDSVESSFSIGVYINEQQIGFARLVTDYHFFAYLADVFILPPYQGKGYGKELMSFIKQIPFVSELKLFCLATKDAHGLYAQYGFDTPSFPEIWMEIRKSNPALEKLFKEKSKSSITNETK